MKLSLPGLRLPASKTLRHIAVLVGGTATAQLIVLLASPLLTRLYTPEQFGFLAVFSALLNTFMVVASLRYQAAVPLATEDRAAGATVVLCVISGVVIALILLLAVWLFGERFALLVNASHYAGWLYLLPVAVLVAGLFEVFRSWSVRKRTFSSVARARVYQGVAMTAVQLVGFRFGVAALIVGQVLGRTAGLGQLYSSFRRTTDGQLAKISGAEIATQARVFRRFPLHSTWGTLLNVTGRQMPALFFAALADPVVAGYFALAQRVLTAPLTMVSDAISGVFTSVGVRAAAESRLLGAVQTFNGALCMLVAIPLAVIVIDGPEIFSLVFGSEWRNAGLYAAIMAPWIFTVLISTSLMSVFSITERDNEMSLFGLGLAISRVLALLAGWMMGSALHAIALFSIVSSISCLIMTMRLYVLAGGRASGALRPLAESLLWAAVVLAPFWISSLMHDRPAISMTLLAGLLIALYYVWLLRRLLENPNDLGLRSIGKADRSP